MDLHDAICDAGLFGEMRTLWNEGGVILRSYTTDEIRLYELSLSPERQAMPVIQQRRLGYAGHLYDEFTEDGWHVSRYTYPVEQTTVEEAMTKYAAA